MEQYKTLEMELVLFDPEDVIITSPNGDIHTGLEG